MIAWKLGQVVFPNSLAYHAIYFGSVLILGFAWALYMRFHPLRRPFHSNAKIREEFLKEQPINRIRTEQYLNELLDKEKTDIKKWQDEVKLPTSIKDGLKILLIRRWAQDASDQEFTEWAVKALEYNLDSPSLRILAGLNLPADREDIPQYFEATLHELSIPQLSQDGMIMDYFHYICKAIVNGAISPDQGIHLIHLKVIDPLSHPDGLMAWCYMWEGNSPDGSFAELNGVARDNLILEYARKELESIKV